MGELDLTRNEYIGLLDKDMKKFKHPLDNNRVVKLYRVIALKSFRIKTWGITVNKYDIGGWVETINNLEDAPVWLMDSARIFDDAIITEDTILKDNALVFGRAAVAKSLISNWSRIYGGSRVTDSKIRDLAQVRGNSIVIDSVLENSALIEGRARIENSNISVGACCKEHCKIVDSKITDSSIIRGTAELYNCQSINHGLAIEGVHKNETFDRDFDLAIKRYEPEEFS